MAKAMMCEAFGPLESLTLKAVEVDVPKAGQVRIAVHAAGVNLNDALKVEGRHHEKPQPPFAPGSGIAGIILDVGEGVQGLAAGDRVVASMDGAIGGFATEAVTSAGTVARIPDTFDFATACGFSASYASAYEAVASVGKVAAGETVVVTGAAGGLGVPAIEIARARGARVIAIVSTPEKAQAARQAGADEVIDRVQEDVRARMLALTGGRGADVVIELVGGDALRLALRYIAFGGRIVITGFTSGDVPEIRAILMLLKGFELRGSNLSLASRKIPGHYAATCAALFELMAQGHIKPRAPTCYPLEKAVDAIRELQAGNVIGKIALTMDHLRA
ncbi:MULTISPECIES: NADPH:quinone oxidoreductase family protein [unclassified Sphingobium]|uniref:NADPH:quinone oxidoreductase family protein n=1 Tax=unclassified Sphingobium TaxID=2611147 RepID=UPI000D1664E8|nr:MULTISPECIES: NADPH:quinone oxidoreductase family protein [unclassified Sphingobium]MBG6119959.1 NADPH2:quinone reductase [Sphingobium sp. JAI105]PSO11874.1 NADPH:quinone oxidoreductase [Sphingobium sp. AEW4]TWC99602.1 NADPH2:quinone reductase [Sphingobium sp. AEW010]TWD18961.1 NADPH2:quinone reductase [Sphingobium sp. AEW013]TWD21832.1 NADPH2:quinone reductase [Sphingobium sp. AEW001]